ncbi:MAG: AarF/ABC1/UbiB kinase family protein, partial [Burkholderiales bacterium]|nr:AarF/ABC1/UbiB kinase family protein [Burkholderiales bacterium]
RPRERATGRPAAEVARPPASQPATKVAVAPAASARKRAPARARPAPRVAAAAAGDARLPPAGAQALRLLRAAGGVALQAAVRVPESASRIVAAFGPLTRLLAQPAHVGVDEFGRELDRLFELLYRHPLTEQTRRFTRYLRERNLLPNEGSTENLIRWVVDETVARSPIPVPPKIVDEFWGFFHELMAEPELRGLADLGLDIARLLLRTYEPLIVSVINELKDIYHANQQRSDALLKRVQVVRGDLQIIRRQIRALRYIRPFLQTDARDFAGQAQIVAKMVREFGPFFVKLAQVAAATADFLPEEIARELAVFQEDVPPMSPEEARAAIVDSFGRPPEAIYFGFDARRPLKSGSIGSVYLAKKPVVEGGVERLVPVVVKIGRHNLDREFLMGKASIGLMLLSSQYWAPHAKLTPFLKAMTAQIDGFVEGFRSELQFEREAAIQARFAQRTQHSALWRVPRVHAATERVIEMEYVDGGVNILRAAAHFAPGAEPAYRRALARRLLFTVLSQVVVHQEVHGDLHPGNVMVDAGGTLHLIDWGNTVPLAGRMAPVWRYLRGALAADADALTDALIAVCTDPDAARARRAEIRDALARTLRKKRIRPLGRGFALTLALEGSDGWLQRARLLGQLMSNTQPLGLVVRGEYLHLSRSAGAMLGTLGSLYKDMPPRRIAADLLWALSLFPPQLLHDTLRGRRGEGLGGAAALARRLLFAEPAAASAPAGGPAH